jgi:nicotinamide-nucleotide amidase
MFPEATETLAARVLDLARARGIHIATAESCTGGLVAGALTAIAGSSDIVLGGVVAYANEIKQDVLGVDPETVSRHGAVSEEVARAMAEGARKRSGAELAVSTTGVAGPGGGSAEKPVGLVWLAAAMEGAPTTTKAIRLGDIGRSAVRLASVDVALGMLEEQLRHVR